MYQVGERIIYGSVGVCEVAAVGPLDMQGAKKDREYYTLSPLYQNGKIFAPVDTTVFHRPVLTREQALALIDQIPGIERRVYENRNPRLLNEQYQIYLKSGDCVDLVRLVRAIYAKGEQAAERGRRLSQVDENCMKRAEELLHNELACALGIRPDEVRDFITRTLEGEDENR